MEQPIYEDMDIMQESENRFKVDSDAAAEWVLDRMREAKREHDRLVAACNAMIEKYKFKIARFDEMYEQKNSWWESELSLYFSQVPHKTTKTQEQYALPSGKLILKQQGPEYLRNDEALLKWLKESGKADFIKTEESPKWGELKKTLSIKNDKAYDSDTGEVVPGIAVQQRPPVFNVVIEEAD